MAAVPDSMVFGGWIHRNAPELTLALEAIAILVALAIAFIAPVRRVAIKTVRFPWRLLVYLWRLICFESLHDQREVYRKKDNPVLATLQVNRPAGDYNQIRNWILFIDNSTSHVQHIKEMHLAVDGGGRIDWEFDRFAARQVGIFYKEETVKAPKGNLRFGLVPGVTRIDLITMRMKEYEGKIARALIILEDGTKIPPSNPVEILGPKK